MNRPEEGGFISGSKNIINVGPEGKKKAYPSGIIDTKSLVVPNESAIDGSNISIGQDDTHFMIKLSKDFLVSASREDVLNLVKMALSPMFLSLPKDDAIQKDIDEEKKKPISGKGIAIFMDMLSHYTGGRYSVVHQGVLLAENFEVTIVANREIPFLKDFRNYPGYNNLKVVVDSQWRMNEPENPYFLVIGLPVDAAQYAYVYCQKWKIPFFCYMFESPNYVSEYRSGPDSTEDFWANFKKVIEKADVRLSPSEISSKYLQDWIKLYDNSFHVVYPCMNTLVADKAAERPIKEYDKDLVYVSRMTSFKNPLTIIKELDRRNYSGTLHIIGKIWQDNAIPVDAFKNVKIKIHGQLDDYEKFRIIASCKALIFPSKFEGFGMPPMEALYFNKPVICYRLPVLEEVYGDHLVYVDGNYRTFVSRVFEVLKNYQLYIPNWKPPFSSPDACKRKLLNIIPKRKMQKVSVGILAFNCNDYLPYVIKSCYDEVDEIVICEGPVKGFEYGATEEYHSSDGTWEWLTDDTGLGIEDPKNKVRIIARNDKRAWYDKIEMQNAIAERVTGDIYIKMDSDEVWDPRTIRSVVEYMIMNKNVDIIRMPFLHFWTSFDKVAVDAGGKWGTCHPRIWRWRRSFRHRKTFNAFQDTAHDNRMVAEPFFVEHTWEAEEGVIFHFGYARKLYYVNQKLRYYAGRQIEKVVKTGTYENWRTLKDSTQPTQNVRSWAVKFNKELLPPIMKEHPYYEIDDIRKLEDEG